MYLLMFFLTCGCGADIANYLDDPLEFWRSNANEGLGTLGWNANTGLEVAEGAVPVPVGDTQSLTAEKGLRDFSG